MTVSPFKISIPESEVALLQRKLQDTRLPTNIASTKWGETDGITPDLISSTVDYWKNSYSWRDVEARLNLLPQYTVPVDVSGFDTITMHFVHSPSSVANAVPLLFVHGWPGSFIEVERVLPLLNSAGFHVVAPSLPGFGFSSYPSQPGFRMSHISDAMEKLMQALGYGSYVVQGGDWGSFVARTMAVKFPERVKAIHTNMLFVIEKPQFETEPTYTAQELAALQRAEQFRADGTAYQAVQSSRPRTLGFAMHDSPVGMLAWMADKLIRWTDSYPWSPEEMITWTLLHYWPGPTTGFVIYRENLGSVQAGEALELLKTYVKQPSGVSVFPKELMVHPRSWAETDRNIKFWAIHDKGGHFAAWERPEELANDMIEFFKEHH